MGFSWGSVDWGAVAGAAASAYGANAASKAAKQAGNQAAEGATESNALQKYIYDDQRALAMPGYQAGLTGLNQYMAMLGLGGIPQQSQWSAQPQMSQEQAAAAYLAANPDVAATRFRDNPLEHYQLYGQREGRQWGQPVQTGGNLPAQSGKTPQQLQQDAFAAFRAAPGYQFGLDEGRKTVEAGAAARGGLNSGATLKALQKFGTDYADQQGYTPYMNKLASLWGGAQTATGQIGSAGQNYANQVGQNFQNAANARAQSTYASGQAWQDGMANMAYFGGRMWDKYKGGA